MAINILRESDTTKSRHVNPAYVDKDGISYIASSDKPFPMIDVNHLRLHEGRAFYAYTLYPEAAKLVAGASIDIAIAWASGIKPHITYDANCGGDAELYLYENAVVTGGTTLSSFSRNRTIATTSASAILLNPTVTSTGTLLEAEFIAGGTGKKSGGGIVGTTEQILAPLTTYLFRLTNVNGTDHMAYLHLEWYE
jgi:hypothetical protein